MTSQAENKVRTAIVTGASTGIGYAISERFLNDGLNVVMNARTEADVIAAYEKLGSPSNVRYVVGDVATKATGLALVAAATEAFGGVDILVNNAGVFNPKPFLDTEEADLYHFFSINFKGAYFTAQAAVPAMTKRGGGSIVNIGTTLLEHAIAGFPASGAVASKAALHSLTEQLAAELSPDNIRVATIATGIIDTPLHAKQGIDDANNLAGLHLLNRIGTPENMADAVAMLANNDFITGTTLRVDGGHSAGHRFG
ncbi:MAG: SDR family oxidoreductase [Ectothiorhodospiraceae bacterium]|nr:SDR family oxidoreductase [Ectothiorhodospiraceae bacterium]